LLLSSGLIGCLALQFAAHPYLVREIVSPAVINSSIVATGEFLKLLFYLAAFFVAGESGRQEATQSWSLAIGVREALLPAFVYTCQNLANTVAHRSLDGVTCNVLNQTKLLFTALFVLVLRGKRQSPSQCIALLLVFAASMVVSLGDAGAMTASRTTMTGVLAAVAGAMFSGLGAVLSEVVLVHHGRDVRIFGVELAIGGILVIAMNLALDLNGDGTRLRHSGFFSLWTPATMLPVLSQAAAGLLVGALTKVLGSIRKAMVVTIGLLMSSLLRVALEGLPSPSLLFSICLVMLGVRLYCRSPAEKSFEVIKYAKSRGESWVRPYSSISYIRSKRL